MSREPKCIRKPVRTRTDQEIIEGVRRSCEADFNLLYERYFSRVYSFIQMRLRNRADSEEVVQEVFIAVFRSIDSYRGQASLVSWIYGIAKNSVNNHLRRAKAQELRLVRATPDLVRNADSIDSYTPEERLNLSRCEAAIQERLASVAEWHTEVFLMRHMENLPVGEIARRVSRSNDAVRSSLYRMKRMLIEAIDPSLVSAS